MGTTTANCVLKYQARIQGVQVVCTPLQKIFEIDSEIFRIGKIFEIHHEFYVKLPAPSAHATQYLKCFP
jgi:hypothetical protein